ncbi:MAG TPA: hypothetical protein VH575_07255, partial [Gemmataceae bacterium]
MSAEPVAPTAVTPSSEYRTRLWMGAVMALAVAGTLVLDHYLLDWFGMPIYPCLLVSVLLLSALSIVELHALMAAGPRPPLWLCLVGGCAMVLANWPAHLVGHPSVMGGTAKPQAAEEREVAPPSTRPSRVDE